MQLSPRRTRIRKAAPDRFRWVLFGTANNEKMNQEGSQQYQKTIQQLREAGVPVSELPLGDETEKASRLCQWVESLGLL